MKRTLGLNLFLAFVGWSTFKALESLVRITGTKDMYGFYGLEWLYYAVIAFSAIGGLALAYAILKAKHWGYQLGFVWLLVGIAHTVFTCVVSYSNKALMTEIMTVSLESRGRDASSVADFVNSSAVENTLLITSAVVISVMLLFMWQLYSKRAYFDRKVAH